MKKKIALCGKMCSGKSFVSSNLVNDGYVRIGFGDPVKKYCTEIFNLKNKDRKLIQSFAQKIKEINPDVWIDYLDNQLNYDPQYYQKNILIDDLRFPNEYQYLRKNNFTIIKLIIDDQMQKERLRKTYPENFKNHMESISDVSESYIDSIQADFVIEIDKNNEKHTLEIIEKYIN